MLVVMPNGYLSQAAARALMLPEKTCYKLYFLACGSSDGLLTSAQTLDSTLTKNGLEHTFFITPGGHTWSNWRIYLNTFLPKLFK